MENLTNSIYPLWMTHYKGLWTRRTFVTPEDNCTVRMKQELEYHRWLSIRTDGLSRYSMKSSSSKIYALPGTPRGKIISKIHALTLWTGLIFGAHTRVTVCAFTRV